ncbi:MAG: hypothetical protein AAGA95_19525 [Pseudomonadota bacterium]
MTSSHFSTARMQASIERFALPVLLMAVFLFSPDLAFAQDTGGRFDFGIDQESSEGIRQSFLSLWRTGGTIALWIIMIAAIGSLVFARGRGLMTLALATIFIFFAEPVIEGLSERASLEDAQGLEFRGADDRG